MKKLTYIFILSGTLIFTNACSKDRATNSINNSINKSENTSITEEGNATHEAESTGQIENSSKNQTKTDEESIIIKEQTKSNQMKKIEGNKEVSGSSQLEAKQANYTANDKEVIGYFKSVSDKVDDTLNDGNSETVKDKLKGTFITIVDFIFYDSEIKGIKFNDLTDGAKQNILDTASMIDSKITAKFPNYKEEISTKTKAAYNKASELIKRGAANMSQFSKDKLGEENYNAIIDAKDELVYYSKNAVSLIGNVANSIFTKSKSKLKSWYENLKS